MNYFNYFLMCWMWGTVSETQLQQAVTKGYLDEAQRQAIVATPRT